MKEIEQLHMPKISIHYIYLWENEMASQPPSPTSSSIDSTSLVHTYNTVMGTEQ